MDINQIKKTVSDAKVYWKRPMPGRYMPFKEIFAYSFGGIGIYFLIYCVQQLMLSTTNVIIGNAIGISPTIMYVIYVISIIISFPATALRANIIDNARSKKGKYRPYMLPAVSFLQFMKSSESMKECCPSVQTKLLQLQAKILRTL